jgi:hypothetical protein
MRLAGMTTIWAMAAVALTAGPAFAQSGSTIGAAAPENAIPAGSRFDLPAQAPAVDVRSLLRPALVSTGAYPVVPLPAGVRDPDGPVQYIDGPAWIYQTGRSGPSFEVAALGGGMASAPFLAHVGVNWHF